MSNRNHFLLSTGKKGSAELLGFHKEHIPLSASDWVLLRSNVKTSGVKSNHYWLTGTKKHKISEQQLEYGGGTWPISNVLPLTVLLPPPDPGHQTGARQSGEVKRFTLETGDWDMTNYAEIPSETDAW